MYSLVPHPEKVYQEWNDGETDAHVALTLASALTLALVPIPGRGSRDASEHVQVLHPFRRLYSATGVVSKYSEGQIDIREYIMNRNAPDNVSCERSH